MRILKTEVQDLHHEDKAETEKPAPAITTQPGQPQVDVLQQQIRDLQAKQSAAEAAKVSGAPVAETQRTQAGYRLCGRNPRWPSWVTPSKGRGS